MPHEKLAEPRCADVLVSGDQQPGHTEAWRQIRGGLLALVRYNVGPGLNHLAWFDVHALRPDSLRLEGLPVELIGAASLRPD